MVTATRYERTLRATLCEVERGVFYATYPDCESALEVDELTSYQVGTSAADAKRTIERCALALGYDTVLWRETISVSVFESHGKAGLHDQSATKSVRSEA